MAMPKGGGKESSTKSLYVPSAGCGCRGFSGVLKMKLLNCEAVGHAPWLYTTFAVRQWKAKHDYGLTDHKGITEGCRNDLRNYSGFQLCWTRKCDATRKAGIKPRVNVTGWTRAVQRF